MWSEILVNPSVRDLLENLEEPNENFNSLLTRMLDQAQVGVSGLAVRDETRARLDSMGFEGDSYDSVILRLISRSSSTAPGAVLENSPSEPPPTIPPPPPPGGI